VREREREREREGEGEREREKRETCQVNLQIPIENKKIRSG
jgi:hypothetical protein